MKRSIAVLGAVSLFALTATAQDVPRAEVFTGFTYTRVNSASNVPAFSANGGGGQFVMNFGKWVGGVADIGAVHNGNIGGYHLDTTLDKLPVRAAYLRPYLESHHAVLPDALWRCVRLDQRESRGPARYSGTSAGGPAGEFDGDDQRGECHCIACGYAANRVRNDGRWRTGYQDQQDCEFPPDRPRLLHDAAAEPTHRE